MDLNAELAVLGKAMQDRGTLDTVMNECTTEHFLDNDSRILFQTMQKLFDSGVKVDIKACGQALPNLTSRISGAWVTGSKVEDITPYMNELIKNKNRKMFYHMKEQLNQLMYDDLFEPEAAEKIVNMFMPTKYGVTDGNAMIEIADAVADMMEELRDKMNKPYELPGASLAYTNSTGGEIGFPSLDKAFNGLRPGDFVMLCAKSGHGKTAMAMNITRILSYHNNKRVYYLNTEMDRKQMVRRWAAMATQTPYEDLESFRLMPGAIDKIDRWAKEFSKAPLTVSQLSDLTVNSVRAFIQMVQRKHGKLDCVIVDYIGRLEMEHTKGRSDFAIMGDMAKALKKTAQDLGVPIIALAQLNHSGDLEGAKKMRNEADMMLYFKPKSTMVKGDDNKDVEVFSETKYELTRDKNRRGSVGTVDVEFDKRYQFIREV